LDTLLRLVMMAISDQERQVGQCPAIQADDTCQKHNAELKSDGFPA
jgi:hypothetical protein